MAPALRVAGGGLTRKLHASTRLRGPEHDDFAPISKVVPDTDILEQIDEVRPSLLQRHADGVRTYGFLCDLRRHPSSSRCAPHCLQTVKANQVVLFMKGIPAQPRCGFSNMVVKILEMEGVEDYAAYDVLADEELRQGIKEYSDWPTIPQLYIDGCAPAATVVCHLI